MAPQKKVGIWLRVSTEDQVKGESPEHHELRARNYATAKEWDIAEVYNLSGFSGKSVWEHPEAVRMRDDVENGHIDALIFSKLARLARNTRELLDFADYFRGHDADLVSLGESIDTSSPAGRLFYTLIAAMAEWEREEISARIAASVPIRAALGKPTGGIAPFGYQWTKEGMKVHPDEAPIRARMYDLFLRERRILTVAKILNKEGHRTRRGNKWSATAVRANLLNPTAKGLHRSNYTTSRGDGKTRLKPESEWVYTEVEPIVSEEKWNAVAEILDERAKRYNRRPAKRVRHLFVGRLFCTCGGKMYVHSGSTRYVCRKCAARIPIDDLEKVFCAQLRDFSVNPDLVEQYLEEADKEVVAEKERLAVAVKQRDDVANEMDKLYRLYIDDEISTKEFGKRNRPLEEQRDQLDREIPKLQGRIDAFAIDQLSREEIAHGSKALANDWDELPHDTKRILVEHVVERVEVGNGEIVFDLAFLPSLEPTAQCEQTPKAFTGSIIAMMPVESMVSSSPCAPRLALSRKATPTLLLALLLTVACGMPQQEGAQDAAGDTPTPPSTTTPRMAPPSDSPAVPPGVELPTFDVGLTVEEAYEAIPHRRTVFEFAESPIPPAEREYLRVMFHLLEQGTRVRVDGYRDLYHHSTTDAAPAENLKRLIEVIDQIEPPEGLEEYHSLIRLALDEQQRVFEDWEIQREAFRHRRRIGGDPRIRGASASLKNAYQILMDRYGDGESQHNRDAFFDYHCAMDFL